MATRNKRGRFQERSPSREGLTTTSYDGVTPVPGSSRRQSPPPYSATPGYADERYQHPHARGYQQGPLAHLSVITKGRIVAAGICLVLLAQLVSFIFFYDLPAKIGRYSEVMGRLRVREDAMKTEAKHLEIERTALQEERMKWEKAREDRVPQGAFWEVIQPSPDCLAYGKREYWGILRNIPTEDWTDLDACMNMPAEIKGVSVRRPNRCMYVEGSPHIHAFWTVDWDQPDCKPWLRDFNDIGCTNPGSGIRGIEAWVVGINEKGGQDWRLLCESMSMTWHHTAYHAPTHCDAHWTGRKIAIWDIPDKSC